MPGPSGEPGVLLLVPASEALDWDLADEVASTARHWMPEQQAWWVAKPYASTAHAIVSRVHGPRVEVEELGADRPGWKVVAPPPARGVWARLWRRLSGARRRLGMAGSE